MSETIYVPKSSAKAKETSFGEVFKLGFHVDTFIEFAQEHKNEGGYINLDMVPRREVGERGDTHSLKLDNWKPDNVKSGGAKAKPAAAKSAAKPKAKPPADEAAEEDIPF